MKKKIIIKTNEVRRQTIIEHLNLKFVIELSLRLIRIVIFVSDDLLSILKLIPNVEIHLSKQ